MKPINYSSDGCDPISSNCVIWNGPDIECIELCKGDNVSTVVHKLATELCELMDTFKVSNFDLSCFDLQKCTPDDFKGLIQLLIDKICENEGISPEASSGGCPDCEVTICQDILFNPVTPGGDPITTMQLKDYVLAIGNRVCSLIDQIGTINSTIGALDVRISALESAGTPSVDLPELTPACVLPAIPTSLDALLAALEQEYCNLVTATGNNTAIITALQAACAGINSAPRLSGTGTMSTLPGWHVAPANLSQSFSNLWKVVCDMRNAVALIQNNCCDTGCGSIDLNVDVVVVDPNTIRIYYTGSIPSNFVDDNPASSIVITDSAGGGPQNINNIALKSTYFDTSQYYEVTLAGPNGANDIYVSTTYRFIDPTTQETCTNTIQAIGLGADTCPDLIITPSYLSVDYTFAWSGTIPTLVQIKLYDAAGLNVLQQNSLNITTSNPSGQFLNLMEGVTYNLTVEINQVECPLESFTTLEYPCLAPGMQADTKNYADPEGDTLGSNIDSWIKDYTNEHP